MKKIVLSIFTLFCPSLFALNLNLEFKGFNQNIKKVITFEEKILKFKDNNLDFKFLIKPIKHEQYILEIEIYNKTKLELRPKFYLRLDNPGTLTMNGIFLKVNLTK